MNQPGVDRIKFVIAVGAVIFIWMVVLPALSDLESVRQRIEGNRAAGINPTAVFYTDHPSMVDIERAIGARVESPSGWFWKPSF